MGKCAGLRQGGGEEKRKRETEGRWGRGDQGAGERERLRERRSEGEEEGACERDTNRGGETAHALVDNTLTARGLLWGGGEREKFY